MQSNARNRLDGTESDGESHDVERGETLLEDEPIKIRWTGKARRRIKGYNQDFDSVESDRFVRALSWQKTNIVIETVEEATAVASEMTKYSGSQRSWMNASMDRALARVQSEIVEEMGERGFDAKRGSVGRVTGFEKKELVADGGIDKPQLDEDDEVAAEKDASDDKYQMFVDAAKRAQRRGDLDEAARLMGKATDIKSDDLVTDGGVVAKKDESEQIAKELGLTDVDVDIDIETFVGGYKQIHLFFDGISVTADILSRIEDSEYRQTTIHWETKCIVLESPEDQIPDKQLVTDGGVAVENDQTDLWTYGQEAAERVDTCPSGRGWCNGPDTDPHCCLGCFEVSDE